MKVKINFGSTCINLNNAELFYHNTTDHKPKNGEPFRRLTFIYA